MTDSSLLNDPTETRSNCGVGVIADLDGGPSHGVLADALDLLENLEHRGTTGAEPNTGDGAGVMIERPDGLFRDEMDLPERYAVGSLFLPTDPADRRLARALLERALAARSVETLAWRAVPTDPERATLGETARASEPHVAQVFVAPTDDPTDAAFDRRLYVARRAAETALRDRGFEREACYVCSLDRQRVVYKGLLTGSQLADYYPDLRDERTRTGVALVHARFSTNTLGAWHLAHPYRNVIHNGEFNTLRGNVNWMRAREDSLAHPALDGAWDAIRPVVSDPDQSDTACLDETLDLLLQGGRRLPHALRLLIPEAYRGDEAMDADRRAFYDYHASLVEPWDGPALVVGFDGDTLTAVLDRNGLRPCRYDVTTDGRLVMASEVGAFESDPSEIADRGRLAPGETFVVDCDEGRLVPDEEVFEELTDDRYADWLADEQRSLDSLAADLGTTDATETATDDGTETATDDGDVPTDDVVRTDEVESGADGTDHASLRARQVAFGYTTDQLNELLEPMAREGADPVGSMGDDTPLSVLSAHRRSLFTYFKQLFAQVSNPPIDYIREELVTSLESRLGPQRNLLAETPEHARQIVADSPILGDRETRALRELDGTRAAFTSRVLRTTFPTDGTLADAVRDLRERAAAAVRSGVDVLVLSDETVGPDRLPIPSLLAVAAVHHHLVREGLRTDTALVVESGDPREVHHVACLIGYGADAVSPRLARETIRELVAGPDGVAPDRAVAAYHEALEDGVLKTMAKMGISTVESYQGAQIFEAVGLDSELVAEYFTGTPTRTEGIGLAEIESDLRDRHQRAFADDGELETHGEYRHHSSGVRHGWNPDTVRSLQRAVRNDDPDAYREFAELVNEPSGGAQRLRDLLAFDTEDRESVSLDAVEPTDRVTDRFVTAAMSLGSLSPEAHENNARAMNRIGSKANTGEGGEPPERFDTERECAVKQVASGRFGVTAEYLAAAEEIQIKMAQGSKPGEGGHLPGSKVNEMIAHVRYATPGVGLISPPPQHDIYSIEDLKQLIHDLRAANPDARINVKLVSEAGIGTIAAGVAKAGADTVHVSGHSGGTGASPKTSIKNAGLPWELGLAEAHQTLCATGLRDRVRLAVDGGFRTGRDAAVAAALGAEEFVFGTASLVSSGCVMARQCHENTCPVGVATQDEDLRDRFPGEPEHVIRYARFVADELRRIVADLGLERVDELVGRPDLLGQREAADERAAKLDLSAVIADPPGDCTRQVRTQDGLPDDRLADDLVAAAGLDADDAATDDSDVTGDELSADAPPRDVRISRAIDNTDRAVGATLSNRLVTSDDPPDSVTLEFEGTAGQSFGAFLTEQVTARLTGAANDYVGKGLSGGRLVVRTPDRAGYDPSETVVVGNVGLYGATRGELYVNGRAGERFAVRNSGVHAVVEGVGDHGCEYMTGGVVAVLGETGRNFAAGMSGGVAYVYDPDDRFPDRVNRENCALGSLNETDERCLRRMLENHAAYTDSEKATRLLADWPETREAFVRVVPDAYRRAVREGADDVRRHPPEPAEPNADTVRVESATGDD